MGEDNMSTLKPAIAINNNIVVTWTGTEYKMWLWLRYVCTWSHRTLSHFVPFSPHMSKDSEIMVGRGLGKGNEQGSKISKQRKQF